MATEEEIIIEDDDEEEDEEEGFKDLCTILNVSEEAIDALQESEEGVELLQAASTYIKKKTEDDEQYEEALNTYQESAEQAENEYRSLQSEVDGYKEQLERLKQDVIRSGKEVEVHKDSVKAHEEELKSAKDKCVKLEGSLDDKSEVISGLKREVDVLTKENLSLKEQNRPPPEVPGDRYELLRLLDRRQLEITRLTEEWTTLNQRLEASVKNKYELQLKMDDCTSQVSSMKLKEQMLTQEKLMSTNQVKWLTDELQTKTDLLNKTRQSLSDEVTSLKTRLRQEEEKRREMEGKVKGLEENKTQLEKNTQQAMKKLQEQREESIQLEEHFRKELSAQAKLLELYKDGSKDTQSKLDDMVKVVDGLQEALRTTTSERDQALHQLTTQQEDADSSMKKMDEEIAMLRTELSTSSKLISSQSSEGGPALIDVETDGGTPGLTMSQVYTRYADAQEQLQSSREENSRLANYLEEIRQELETKGPVIYKLKKDYDSAVNSNDQLKLRVDHLLAECEQLRLQVEDGLEGIKTREMECAKYRQLAKDLRRQVQSLLKEVEEGQGGVVSTSYSLPEEEDEGNISSSAEVISKRLVTFKSISDLQTRNEELLAVVRELSSHNERMELELTSEGAKELKLKLEAATRDLDSLREARERQKEMVEAIVRQRDMYKLMASQSVPVPQVSHTHFIK
jgi:nucleoprotein TPR